MKSLTERDPYAMVTSVQQLLIKSMKVTRRFGPSAVLGIFRHTVILPSQASILKVHLIGKFFRDH